MTRVIVHLARGREWRGGEFQVLLLARTLQERGSIDQVVVTGDGSHLAAELTGAGVPVAPVGWAAAWDPRALTGLVRQLNAISRRGQEPILHVHDSHALALGLLVRRITGTPVVATRRSITIPGGLWRQPDRVIAISRAVAQLLGDAGVPSDIISVVPSTVAPEHFREVRHAPPLGDPPLLVAIGAPTEEKGHATLREAMALLSPAPRLAILTDGTDEATLSRAALFVQPSYREALGTAVLIAMARGIPVVASRTGGLIELLEDDAGVLVPPADPQALAVALRQVLADASLREQLVRKARQRVEDYRPGRMADRVTDVYASVLSRP